MSQSKHFLYEHRSKGIPKDKWGRFRQAVHKLHTLVEPMSGSPGSPAQIVVVRSDDSTVSFKLGQSDVTIKRIWPTKQYGTPKLPSTLDIDALSDLFIRSVYLALFFHAPKSTALELRSTGRLDGWSEARHLFEQATGEMIDIDLMVADEKLCKGFSSPLPKTGDAHLHGLAEKVTGIPNPSDMGDPESSSTDEPEVSMDSSEVPAAVSDIPFVSHSWFF